jgi:hypothetical protein
LYYYNPIPQALEFIKKINTFFTALEAKASQIKAQAFGPVRAFLSSKKVEGQAS